MTSPDNLLAAIMRLVDAQSDAILKEEFGCRAEIEMEIKTLLDERQELLTALEDAAWRLGVYQSQELRDLRADEYRAIIARIKERVVTNDITR